MGSVLENIGLFLLGLILPVKIYIALVGMIIIVDTVFGLLTYKKRNEPFSFKKLCDGMFKKMFFYTPIVISVFYLDTHVLNEMVKILINVDLFVTRIVTVLVLSREVWSINKNFGVLTGKTIVDRFFDGMKIYKSVKKDFKDPEEDNENN